MGVAAAALHVNSNGLKGGEFMRTLLALAMALAVVCLAVAPYSAHAAGILRIAQNTSDLRSMDPHFATTTQDRSLVDMIFNGLVRYKPGDGSVFEPDLATSLPTPRMEGAKQAWTFQLRKEVMCHASPGVPSYELTSEDVVYSLKKSADKNRSAYAADYAGMTVEAPDAYTVKIMLDKPVSPVLFFANVANYSGGFIVCKKAAEKLGPDGMKTQPVGTGPFMFKSYSPQERVELVANPAYFRGRPQLDGVDYRFMPDLSSRELALRNGQLDVINGAPDKAWVDKMKGVSGVKVDVFGVGEVATLNLNMTAAPLDKVEVRKAIAYALDRDEFLALIGPGIAENVYSPVPAKFLAGGLTQAELAAKGLDYKTDLQKAKRLLAQAGYPNGFSMDLITSEQTGYRVLYESMQAQLAKAGIKVDLKLADHATMHTMIRKDANPLAIYIAWRPNADVYLTQFLHSDSIVVTGKKPNTNFSHYNKIDGLIEQARNETDQAKQVALWKEAQIKVLDDMVVYPIQYQNQVYARSTAVDYGHELISVLALYPGIDEKTRLTK
jgi:peptide/nickel transport system substrate-binding protein